jgi:hypothetical protein
MDSRLSSWIAFYKIARVSENLHVSKTDCAFFYRDMWYDTYEACDQAAMFEAIRLADIDFVDDWHAKSVAGGSSILHELGGSSLDFSSVDAEWSKRAGAITCKL